MNAKRFKSIKWKSNDTTLKSNDNDNANDSQDIIMGIIIIEKQSKFEPTISTEIGMSPCQRWLWQ